MPRREQHVHQNLQIMLGSLLVVWGSTVGYNREINLVHLLVTLAVGLGCMLVWLHTADFGSKLVSAFIGNAGFWLIGFALGMGLHWQLTPLFT
jgi:hypothetical protein